MRTELPLPSIIRRSFNGIVALSDDPLFDAVGVRIAFTSRNGGVSKAEYGELNLGNHVGDDPRCVEENRRILLDALGVSFGRCLFANQLHGDRVVVLPKDADADMLENARIQAIEEADGILVGASNTAALLCFADCVPVIIVSPTGAFAVVHAGWRGVMACIAPKAVRMLASHELGIDAADLSDFNVYIGPHIHSECFEISEEICREFCDRFGDSVATDARHVDLSAALAVSLEEVGVLPERIADVGICTQCHPDEYFSYRASGGVCGRHGAIAFREDR